MALASADEIRVHASVVLALHWTRQEWTQRRTDRTVFQDDRPVRWSTRLEIQVPDVGDLTGLRAEVKDGVLSALGGVAL